MEAYNIRAYIKGDEPGVCAVLQAVFEEYDFPWQPERYNADTHDIETHYIKKNGEFWVAEHDGVIIGAGAFLPLEEQTCELHRLYFLKEHRGKGIGGKMFLTIAEAARDRGFSTMVFWSDKVLVTAHSVYETYGASLIGERHVSDPKYASYDEWGYSLELSEFLQRRQPRSSSQ